MKKIHTEILIIGGGATGTGVLRDLAMRGFDCVLVEKRDLTHGTTGRFHGLLHSGARYAVKDPEAAQECSEENRILRRIMPHCIEDTGGFFVLTPWDDPGYADSFLVGCHRAGISVEEVDPRRMLTEEPLLNPKITRCFRVPDGSVDSFAAAHANVASAREHGARVFTYHEVIRLLTEDRRSRTDTSHPPSPVPRHVTGALCRDLVHDEEIAIHADMVVNAAGAWAGKIGATAGIEIAIRPGKGTMVAVSHRIVNTVINRCKMPSDGDILVPAHTVAIMGTTDQQVPDPDHFAIEPWEVQLMLEEGKKIIPGFEEMRMLRAWAGVRPLYEETRPGGSSPKPPSSSENSEVSEVSKSRDITRSFVLLDHEARDGVSGLLTITSGKWTTYRKMAEITADLICEKLGTRRECRTHLEELPTADGRQTTGLPRPRSSVSRHHVLGDRLARIEATHTYGQLICECELVTRADVERAIQSGDVHTLDDIRRDLRLGMGPCQGGFCTLRAAGILQSSVFSLQSSVEDVNTALHDFLQERWKGVLPILWSKQLQQERLNELIYLNVLNVEHLPGPGASRLGAENYELPTTTDDRRPTTDEQRTIFDSNGQRSAVGGRHSAVSGQRSAVVVVIGAGLAGLTAAWQAASRGLRTKVIAKGWGATHWGSGCIDVLGYYPVSAAKPVEFPVSAIARLVLEQPMHPYARTSLQQIDAALRDFQALCAEAGYPLPGTLERNWLLPSAAGAFRPTCLAPETMIAGDLHSDAPMLLVGFEGYHDFYPHFAAANLSAQGIPAEAVMLDLPSLRARRRVDTMALARLFDNPEFRAEVAEALTPRLGNAARVGFPAVLGLHDSLRAARELESSLGRRVFELPGLPPSIPGMRLHDLLVQAIREAGGQVYEGIEVVGVERGAGSGRRSAVIGQWSAVGGQWSAVSGQRSAV
ncbi:MAG: anaerobic glycerol-3-phosphate dehydrogenase subunit A, partial [Chloroflexi bacterium]|nr:anaerobic glycerol-3-phosphate dehydrogenase subunit A [Chloroflexota bacterium]